MGSPKMLLTFNGITMIETVIKNVENSDVDNTIVVLGANYDILSALVLNKGVKYCYNKKYEEGMLSSVICGCRNLPPELEAVLVFQGDQPLIKANVINRVIEEYRASGKGIVIPAYEGKRGHPLLFVKKYINEIEKLEAREGLRSLAYLYSDDVHEVETDDSGILRDFNTFEDYQEEINQKR